LLALRYSKEKGNKKNVFSLIFYIHRNRNNHLLQSGVPIAKMQRDVGQTLVREHAKALNKRFGEDGREEKEYGDGDQTPLKSRRGALLQIISRELTFIFSVICHQKLEA
jgi:hypothetical protein